MKARISILLFSLLCSYLTIVFPFTSYMQNKPFVEKLGYTPEPGVLKLISADQQQFVAASLLMTVISYYGSFAEQAPNRIQTAPEFSAMQKMIMSAIQLDPYNMDAYYFTEAIVWYTGQVTVTNSMLEYGMRYRDWDFYLPFFAGFNYAFFLKDYANAAKHYQRVGELTGSDLTMNLAGRYMYESGRTDMAISYLALMARNAGNDAVKKSLQTRLNAFVAVRKIEQASERFKSKFRRLPHSIEELVRTVYLVEIPVDPYGGKFYIDDKGKVRSTSKFAFGVAVPAR